MANWCNNRIAIYATSKAGDTELKRLYLRIKGLGSECHSVPQKAMEYEDTVKGKDGKIEKRTQRVGDDWYGMLLLAHEVPLDKIEDSRGSLLNCPLWSDVPYNHIYLQTETAWDPKEHIIDEMLYFYNDLAYVYTAEEGGMGIYINTDESGTFFPEKYYVEWDICGWGGDNEYPDSLDSLVGTMKAIVDDLISEYPKYKSELLKKIEEKGRSSITETDVLDERANIEEFLNSSEEPSYEYEYFHIEKFESC